MFYIKFRQNIITRSNLLQPTLVSCNKLQREDISVTYYCK